MFCVIIRLKKIITNTLDGRKVMFMPYFLKDAFKTGHALAEFRSFKFHVDYYGEKNGEMIFLLTPIVGGRYIVYQLVEKLRMALGSSAQVDVAYKQYYAG